MPNIKSAIKRAKTNKIRNLRNSSLRSELKTSYKKAMQAILDGSENVHQLFNNAVKLIDKAASKRVLHKNTASRKKARLARALNKMKSSA